jgi:hypothetical protein
VLEGRAKFDHYMGALLLAPEAMPRAFGATPVVQVVDGQQRLTTFLILLSAMREVGRKHNHETLVKEIGTYLFNQLGRADTDPLARFKLTPSPVDRNVFLDILEKSYADVRLRNSRYYWGQVIPQNTPVRSLRAYEYFKAQIEEFVASGAADDTEIDIDIDQVGGGEIALPDTNNDARRRLDALLEALVFHLKLIVITLGPEDDAQVIFETLNSKGQPLLAMDLVRNNIFHRAEAQYRGAADARERAEALYANVWQPFDDGWWRDNAPNARPARPRIDHFLANVLTAETGERITVRELYAEYRAWAAPNRTPRFPNVEEELAVLQRHAPTYKTLENHEAGDAAISWLGDRLRLWQNTTVYPVAFQIASSDNSEQIKWEMVRLLDSYLTRRALCDLTPKNLNQIFPRLAQDLKQNRVSLSTLKNFFSELRGPSALFPTDGDLRNGIVEKPAYQNIPSRILGDILWQIELSSRTSKTEATSRPNSLWIEHVMPQSWQENWPLLNTDGTSVRPDENSYGIRQRTIQTLGNLTIVTSALNIALKNGPFKDKKDALFEHSNLTINREFSTLTTWDEVAIEERGDKLAELASQIWPGV